jgi:hypothetical protein
MKAFYLNPENQTIVDIITEKTLYFGMEDFKNKILQGDCCFICGASPEEKPFNNEHVIPGWILKKFGLHDKKMTLPNKARVLYGSYKIQCCQDCNSLLGSEIEGPMSKLFSQPYKQFVEIVERTPEIIQDIFRWICLIYAKVHLKDKNYSYSLDKRVVSGPISDRHSWEHIHHIHAIARSFYTKPKIDPRVYGTIYIVPAYQDDIEVYFDYYDSSFAYIVILQLGSICIISSLNDSCAGFTYFKNTFSRINGPLTRLQIREIAANLFYINVNLLSRPLYFSSISEGNYEIGVELPKTLELAGSDEALSLGEIMYDISKDILPKNVDQELLKNLKAGRWTFLFDETGKFINNSLNSDK